MCYIPLPPFKISYSVAARSIVTRKEYILPSHHNKGSPVNRVVE